MSGRAVFLWVVIPFVALSALALWLTRDTPTRAVILPTEPPPPPSRPAAPLPPAPPRVEPPPPAPLPAPPSVEDEPMPEPPPGTWTREEVRGALEAVQPRLRECLADAELRHVGPQTVRLRFTLQAQGEQGRFRDSAVVESSLQDPFVFACIEDAFAETSFSAPSGRLPLTLTWPVHSRTRKKGVP